jgi:hypothetical protein
MSTKSAVIIDNRPIGDAIDRHAKFLPSDWAIVHLTPPIYSIHDYNLFMTSKHFWESMTDVVLIFQADSGLLRNGIEDFLEWDYVGASWSWQEHGGNGGLSLRKRDAMLEIINKSPYNPSIYGNEDVFYGNAMKQFGMNLAPREVCKNFSVEACFSLGSLGYHAIDKYLTPNQVKQIMTQYD